MRTLDEYRRIKPVAKPERAAQVRAIAQEAVRMDALTSDPTWDHFLSYIEAAIKTTTRMIDQETKRLRDPRLVDDAQMRLCKAGINALEARLATLKEVIALPKYLKERGTLAVGQVSDMAKGS